MFFEGRIERIETKRASLIVGPHTFRKESICCVIEALEEVTSCGGQQSITFGNKRGKCSLLLRKCDIIGYSDCFQLCDGLDDSLKVFALLAPLLIPDSFLHCIEVHLRK